MTGTAEYIADQLEAINNEVNAIVEAMRTAGFGELALTLASNGLTPAFRGIMFAHAQSVAAEQVEDTLANIYLISLAYYFKRRYTKRDEVVKAAQEVINHIAQEIGNNIDKDFPAGPIIPPGIKKEKMN
jgi:hypothetical protein